MAILTGTSSLGVFVCAGKYTILTSFSNKKNCFTSANAKVLFKQM